jgi:hypothetical protein
MNLTNRVDKLWEVFGDSQLLFGGATMEDLAKVRPFSKDKSRVRQAPRNVRRLIAWAALDAAWYKQNRTKHEAERPKILARLRLPATTTLGDIRLRIIEIGWEIGFTQHEIGFLEKTIRRP